MFENIEYNNFIWKDNEIINILNEILLSNDYNSFSLFSYFISGFIYVLNKYGDKYKNFTDKLKLRMKLSLTELKKLDEIANKKENKDKIITFKTFLTNVLNFESILDKIKELKMYFNNFFNYLWEEKFNTNVYIDFDLEKHWTNLCFISFDIITFNLFTFFKVNEVKINFEEKCAEVSLEVVGKNKIFEEFFCEDNKNDYNIKYNEKNNIIEILN